MQKGQAPSAQGLPITGPAFFRPAFLTLLAASIQYHHHVLTVCPLGVPLSVTDTVRCISSRASSGRQHAMPHSAYQSYAHRRRAFRASSLRTYASRGWSSSGNNSHPPRPLLTGIRGGPRPRWSVYIRLHSQTVAVHGYSLSNTTYCYPDIARSRALSVLWEHDQCHTSETETDRVSCHTAVLRT